jgi:hypothetical protein
VGLLLNGIVKLVLTKKFPVCHDGYKLMLKWSLSFGRLKSVGFKGTGTYSVGFVTIFLIMVLMFMKLIVLTERKGD